MIDKEPLTQWLFNFVFRRYGAHRGRDAGRRASALRAAASDQRLARADAHPLRLKALHQLPDDWTLTQCLFGEHLLALYPDKPVALVESEKTAVICAAALPDYLWLATGGKRKFGSKLDVLKGRKVVAFPDVDGYEEWKSKLSPLGITVSDWLEKTATEDERVRKIDLADRIIEEQLSGC